ncbi:hypothetical protein [Vibrio sp. SCSIO 43137]|uniref:hypothetical protein n=1 Tax=Vibrio sp. SCSIO 43137 TaxID=3021011 RepID=UPI002306DD1B|nr:hypothetical protein [Vibrio sp. SCSIO 43137]WCE29975.1 hypothetical protein PK654_01290 [Vibrio sp. SCSIO 43137]
MLGIIVSSMLGMVTDSIKGKREEKAKEREIKAEEQSKRLEHTQQGNLSASELDALSIKQVGWKDEFLLIVTFIPVIMCFFPDLVSYVREGFAVLETMPEWFKYLVASVVIHSLGFRRFILPMWEAFAKRKWG